MGGTEGLVTSQGLANAESKRKGLRQVCPEVMDGGCPLARTEVVNAPLGYCGTLWELWFRLPRQNCCIPGPDPS